MLTETNMTDEFKDQKTEPEIPMIEKDKYLRLAADFENYRRQQAQAALELAKYAGQSVITEMLALADMVDAAIAHAPPSVKAEKAWFDGIERVAKRFTDDMKKYGVQRIETENQTFDPVTMEAVQMVEGGENHRVQSEVRAGYTMHDRVIRSARVIVYK